MGHQLERGHDGLAEHVARDVDRVAGKVSDRGAEPEQEEAAAEEQWAAEPDQGEELRAHRGLTAVARC